MSNDTPASGSNGCTCGGCGTGTTCAFTDTTMKASSQGNVYAYAGPDVKPWEQPNKPAEPGPLFFDASIPDQYRAIAQAEMLKDVFERVQKLEGEIKALKEENLELLGSLDALRDIVEEEAKKPTSIFDFWAGSR